MDASVPSMKYHELRQYAKELGINNFNGMPKKEQIMDAIKAHFDASGHSGRVEDGEPPVGSETRQTRARSTRRTRLVEQTVLLDDSTMLVAQTAALTLQKKTAADEPAAVKKKKKSSKNDAVSNDAENDADLADPTKRKKKTRKAKETSDAAEAVETEFVAEKKKTKKKSKFKTAESEENRAKKSPEKKTKKAKKATKTKKAEEEGPKMTSVPENPTVIPESPSKENDDEDINLKLEEEDEEEAVVATETPVPATENVEIDRPEPDNPNREPVIEETLQERVNEQSGEEEEEDKVPFVLDNSLITDDESNDAAPRPAAVETNSDVMNVTVEKEMPANEPMEEAEAPKAAPPADSGNSNAVSCVSFYHLKQPEQTEAAFDETKPKKTGARIVRPKQIVKVAEPAAAVQVDETIKVVEIIKREAGPRIVKPASKAEEIVVDEPANSKRKKTNANPLHDKNNELKKAKKPIELPLKQPAVVTKPTKLPDFKEIHQKNEEKLVDIVTYSERVQERHAQLASGSSPQVAEGTEAPPKPSKPTSSATVTHIPRLAKHQSKAPESKAEQPDTSTHPRTPTLNGENSRANLNKTPMSTSKPNRLNMSSALQSARKPSKFAQKAGFKFENGNLESNINFSAGCVFNSGPVTSSNLATSSFNRRKSYDLNASLARPLNYNPHHGKLKPIDVSTKSLFLDPKVEAKSKPVPRPFADKLNKPTANLNETVVISKSAASNGNEKGQTLAMQRAAFKLTGFKPTIDLDATVDLENAPTTKQLIKEQLHQKRKQLRKLQLDVTRPTQPHGDDESSTATA